MSNFCLKFILVSPLVILLFLFLSTPPVHATRTITSVTLNGSNSVTVAPSASITTVVNVTTIADGSGATWGSTRWAVNGVNTCVNHTDHTGAGSYTETFTITAPASTGTYNTDFVAFVTNTCGTGPSNTYTLTDGIIVTSIPTSTPTPTSGSTSTPTPTSAPGSTSSPTPTSSSSSGSGSSSSTSTTIYPSITLRQAQGLLFSGTASISQGSIDSVEFSLDDGNTWQKASPKDGKFDEISEDYFFTPESAFNVGVHKIIARAKSLAQVYTEVTNYASVAFTVSAPKISLDIISPNPTKDRTPTITGTVSSNFSQISNVQITLDEGKIWFPAKLSGKKFSLTTKLLEDGNYQIRARAFDSAGNIGESETQILIIDTIPPIIGGNVTTLGPQILSPDGSGTIRTVIDAENTIFMSMRGGVTKANLDAQDGTFDLAPIEGTNLWTGKIIFNKEGIKPIKVIAIDGAGNKTERQLSPFLIEKSGRVVSIKNSMPVKDAQVSLYNLVETSDIWVLWEGSAFGQKNPQKTDEDGNYSYIVPAGRYFLEVKVTGFRTMRSEIFDLSDTTVLVATFPLSPKPKINFHFPILGKLEFIIPLPYFTQTLSNNDFWKHEQTSAFLEFGLKKGVRLPDFSLPDSGGIIVKSSGLKGKTSVLTFLSIWAPPSNEQALILNATYQKLGEGQSMLAVFLQDSPGEVVTFMKRGNYNFDAVIDKDGITSADYQISALPQHVFIDSEGVIYDTFTGVLNEEELLEKINRLD